MRILVFLSLRDLLFISPCYGITDTLLFDVQWIALYTAPPPCLALVQTRRASLSRSRLLHNYTLVSTRRAEGRLEIQGRSQIQSIYHTPYRKGRIASREEVPGLAAHRFELNSTPLMETSSICSRFCTGVSSWISHCTILPPAIRIQQ